jgi:hypothetical protein
MSSSKLLILNAMVLGGRGRVGPGGGALINGICDFIKYFRGATCSFRNVRIQLKGTLYEPKSKLTNTRSAGTLISDFQPPELGGINLFLSLPDYGILLQKPKWTKTQ